MDIDILSLFPDYFTGPFDESILKRAREKGILTIRHVNLRDFTEDKHRRVDDRPYGGGPGMVLMAPPVQKAIHSVRQPHSKVLYLSPRGTLLSAEKCQELAQEKHLILLCGHYEGVDERVIAKEVDEEISIGDYVLTNGALAAIVLVDAVSRFIPGVLGHAQAALEDSFQEGILDCAHFTRPEEFEKERVPSVLLSGNHEEVARWRKEEALKKTRIQRPDLYYAYLLRQKEPACEKRAHSGSERVDMIFPVSQIKKSTHFYRKCMGFMLLQHTMESVTFQVGNQSLILVKGEPAPSIGLKLVIEEAYFKEFLSGLLREKEMAAKLKIQEGVITFQDPDGYGWIVESL